MIMRGLLATNIQFDAHTHGGGEEFVVFVGVSSDEHGDDPAGTWVRSQHLSKHDRWSDDGRLI